MTSDSRRRAAADRDVVDRIIGTWTDDARRHAEMLASLDPSWGTETFPLAGGWAVLCGPGLYVNRLMGADRRDALAASDLDQLESAAKRLGVPPAVEQLDGVTSSEPLLISRDYVPTAAVAAAVRDIRSITSLTATVQPDKRFVFETVTDAADLMAWQAAAAAGFGHVESHVRRASDAYARAAAAVPGSSLLVVRDAGDLRAVATCSLTVNGGIATLGGMSVVPTERRSGVQAAAIAERVRRAAELGCDLAVTSTIVGGESERNVARYDFRKLATITTWTLIT